MKVLKFGGTSIRKPGKEFEQLLPIITSQAADKHLFVLSAVSEQNDLVALSGYTLKETKPFKHIIYFAINIKSL